jgi:hypothetical protein
MATTETRNLDSDNPTEADRLALREAMRLNPHDQTVEQAALIARYMAATCGDCVDGRCHPDRRGTPADGRCTCARHLVSTRWRT